MVYGKTVWEDGSKFHRTRVQISIQYNKEVKTITLKAVDKTKLFKGITKKRLERKAGEKYKTVATKKDSNASKIFLSLFFI